VQHGRDDVGEMPRIAPPKRETPVLGIGLLCSVAKRDRQPRLLNTARRSPLFTPARRDEARETHADTAVVYVFATGRGERSVE